MYPILFEFGSVTVFSLWFMIALGFAAGSLAFVRMAKRCRIKLNFLSDKSFSLFFWTLLVSRIFFIIFHSDLYFYHFSLKNLLSVFAIWDKGLSFWGAVFAWFIGIWYIASRQKIPSDNFLRVMDIMILSLLCGIFFGNLGALLDGINYGTPTSLPWGVTFRSANVKYISSIHPTQIYAALYSIGIAFGLFFLLKKIRGQLAGFAAEAGVFLFCLFKFSEEFFRGDETVKLIFIRMPQLLAFLGILASGYLIYQRYTNKNGGDPNRLLSKFIKEKFSRKLRKPNPPATEAKTSALQNQTA